MRRLFPVVSVVVASLLAACGASSEGSDSSDESAALATSDDAGSGNGTADGSTYAHDKDIVSCWLQYATADGASSVVAASGEIAVSKLVAEAASGQGLVVADEQGAYGIALYWAGSASEYLPVVSYLYNQSADGTVSYVSTAWIPSLEMPSKNALLQLQGQVTPFERADGDAGTQTYSQVFGNCAIYAPGKVITHSVTPLTPPAGSAH